MHLSLQPPVASITNTHGHGHGNKAVHVATRVQTSVWSTCSSKCRLFPLEGVIRLYHSSHVFREACSKYLHFTGSNQPFTTHEQILLECCPQHSCSDLVASHFQHNDSRSVLAVPQFRCRFRYETSSLDQLVIILTTHMEVKAVGRVAKIGKSLHMERHERASLGLSCFKVEILKEVTQVQHIPAKCRA